MIFNELFVSREVFGDDFNEKMSDLFTIIGHLSKKHPK